MQSPKDFPEGRNDPLLPQFVPSVPKYLLEGRSAFEVYMLQQDSIARQQMEHVMRQQQEVINRLASGERRFQDNERRTEQFSAEVDQKLLAAAVAVREELKTMKATVDALEKWHTVLTSKWAVVSLILTALALPVGLLFLSVFISKKFGH